MPKLKSPITSFPSIPIRKRAFSTMSSSTTRKVRFLIISDTHNQTLFPANDTSHTFRHPPPACDVLLHCGDLTMTGELHEYSRTLSLLASIPAELKLVIAGNHDLTLDKDWWLNNRNVHRQGEQGEWQAAHDMWRGQAAKDAGVTYLEEGMHQFTLKSGATFKLYASPYQPEFYNWAFPYAHHEDRFNPPGSALSAYQPRHTQNIAETPIPDWPNVDIVMTHGPPLHVLDQTERGSDVGCPHLLSAIARARPRLHCFGHIHEGWGVERGVWPKKRDPTRPFALVESSQTDSSKPFSSIEKVTLHDMNKSGQGSAKLVDVEGGWSERAFGESTLFVNAAIMDVEYKPVNAPLVVDLELPVAGRE